MEKVDYTKKWEDEEYFLGTPEEFGKITAIKEVLVKKIKTSKPSGWFFGEEGEYWRIDRMNELPEDTPIKISYKKYEKEQIEKTGQEDWWNAGSVDDEEDPAIIREHLEQTGLW